MSDDTTRGWIERAARAQKMLDEMGVGKPSLEARMADCLSDLGKLGLGLDGVLNQHIALAEMYQEQALDELRRYINQES